MTQIIRRKKIQPLRPLTTGMTVWWHPDASGSSPAVWCIPAPGCRWSSWSVPTACPTGEPSAGAYLSHLGSYSLFHLPASNQRQIKMYPTLIKHAFILFLYNLLIKQYLCQNICKTIYNPFYIFFFTFVSTLLKSWKEFMFAGGFGNPRAMSIIFRCFAMSDSFYTINRKRMS